MNEDALNWLHDQKQTQLLIQKEEDGDIDKLELTLNDVTIGHLRREDPDNFVENVAILLHGEGFIALGDKYERLPQDVFEIPISDYLNVEKASKELRIKTGRAKYLIKPNN